MADHIICVALKRNGRMSPAHPRIKRIVQEQIGQQWVMTPPCGVPLSLGWSVPSGNRTQG